MEPFDLGLINSSERRNYLSNLLARGAEAFDSIKASYAPGSIAKLNLCYVNQQTLNAYAFSKGSNYFVELEISSILLIDALIKRLLADARILPEIPVDSASLMRWNLPFTEGIEHIELEKNLLFELDESRFQISRVLADFCATFILFHEVGHVCCGHTSGVRFYLKKERYSEYLGFDRWLRRGTYLRRAWEIDADMFAGSVLCQCFRSFEATKKPKALAEALLRFPGGQTAFIGLVLAALSAMFVYISQKNYEIKRLDSHPAPTLRSKSIGNAVILYVSKRTGIAIDELIEARITYMSQIWVVMEDLGWLDWDDFDSKFTDSDCLISRDILLQKRFRESCAQWAIVPPAVWG